MTRFRKWKSVGKSYREQALIWAFCQCREAPEVTGAVRAKIERLIRAAGGEYAEALENYLCTDASWEWVVSRYNLADSTLQRCVRRFLELW